MTLALIFNGQGAHYQGMGLDFVDQFPEAARVFDLASQVTGYDIRSLVDQDIEKLSQTRYAQVATAAVSMAIFELVKDRLPQVAYMAGLSLGEYSSLMASGMISLEEGFKLLKDRGDLMSDHCQHLEEEAPVAMEAVLKVDATVIEDLVAQVSAEEELYVANYNSSTQTVIAGSQAGIDRFKQEGKEKGIKKTLPLSVEGPFHTPFMQAVCPKFEQVLETVDISAGRVPVISNTKVQVHQVEDLKGTLVQHLVEPVRWQHTIDYFLDQGVDQVVQIGPGKTLGNLLKREKVAPDYVVVDKLEDLEALNTFIGG